jgi:hypothetical protein
LYTLKKIGALPNPINGKKGSDGATKPKMVLHLGTPTKSFVRNLFRFRKTKNGSVQNIRNLINFASNLKGFVLNPKGFVYSVPNYFSFYGS